MFAVLAVEAFFNEVTEIAVNSPHKAAEPEVVVSFARFMNDGQLARVPLLSRLIHSYWILTGKNVERGAAPFQDFALLVGLRNDLVHFKPNEDIPFETGETYEEVHEKRLKKLKSKNILATFPAGKASWTFYIETKMSSPNTGCGLPWSRFWISIFRRATVEVSSLRSATTFST